MYTASWTAVTHRPASGKGYVQQLADEDERARRRQDCYRYGPLLCNGP